MAPRVVIVGPPGAGKTTIGHLLAARLSLPWRDSDADIERNLGKSVADIFIEDGEAAFRAAERTAVAAALREHEGILALGGGAILDADTRADLIAHHVLQLTVEITDAASRIGFNRDRPLLLGNPRQQWLALMRDRRPLYDAVARWTVATDGQTPDQVVEAALTQMEQE